MNNNGEVLFGLKSDSVIGRPYSDILGVMPEIEKLYSKKTKDKNRTEQYTYFSKDQKHIIKARPFSTALDEDSVLICISKLSDNEKKLKKNAGNIHPVDTIFGDSEDMLKAKKIAKKVANTSKSVLLIGESGTGKELFARAIHEESRPDGPFIAVNCAALPQGLLESELFGYEGGSFTGADKKGHIGKIELAHNGTLFLDEIGDMPLLLQTVLLRVLEDKQVMPIGGNQYRNVDFRVVAATNRNLKEMITNKTFREDLYYRIATFEIQIPPLRHRNSDILKLAQRFLEEECAQTQIAVPKMDDAVIQKIIRYDWMGNVRELRNAMDYALTMSMGGKITLDDLPVKMTNNENSTQKKAQLKTIAELEREAIESAMFFTKNNVKDASEILNMSRTSLYRKLKEFGFEG